MVDIRWAYLITALAGVMGCGDEYVRADCGWEAAQAFILLPDAPDAASLLDALGAGACSVGVTLPAMDCEFVGDTSGGWHAYCRADGAHAAVESAGARRSVQLYVGAFTVSWWL
jgi:hypothetical protein